MSEVAVLIATYNGEKYITELIESIMKQTFQDFICYIHDDGSSDNTMGILLCLQEQYKDKIIILNYPSMGSSKANFMSMLSYVSEPYIMFADQDDYWLKDKIEVSLRRIKEMETDKTHPCLVFTDLEVVDSTLKTLEHSFMVKMGFNPRRLKYQQLMAENVGAGCTMMMNRPLLEEVVKLKDVENIRMHDGWFMVVAAIYGKISYINQPTILYRQHETNVFGSKKESLFQKVRKNATLFFTGQNVAAKRMWLRQMDKMAYELLAFNDLPETVHKKLTELVSIHDKNKITRILFYVKNDFLRNKNNLWMLVWV